MQGRHGPCGNRRVLTPAMPGKGGFFRFLSGACLALLLCSAPPALFALTIPAGDLAPLGNPDGELDAADYLILQRFILGTLTPTPEQHLIADVAPLGNPDGELNVGDLVVLMRAIHGQIELPPVYLGPDAPVFTVSSGITHANPYTLTGVAEAGREVRLYLNGVLYASTTASGIDGGFEFRLVLRDGENPLYAVVVDAGQEGTASELIVLNYVNDAPRSQSGVIAEDTVWTPGVVPEPYVITSTLTVAPGATLTLVPGTVLRFAAGAALQIEGAVIAVGDPAAPIRFTAEAVNPVPGNWSGIQVRAGSQNTRLENVIVEYASNGITVDATNLIVRDCTVQSFASGFGNYGVGYINGSTGSIENCTIDNQGAVGNNNSRGIYVGSDAQPDVKGNRIRNNRIGILIEQSAPWIFGNTVSNNSWGILLLEGARALINGQNIITDNYSAGLQFEGGATEFPQCIVNGNSILNNRWNVYTVSYDYVGDQDVVVDNNWWGSDSPSVISSGIWDFKNLPEMAPVVKVAPFLDGPGGQPVSDEFLSGRATESVELVDGQTYTVLGAYVLDADVPLTVQPGTRIELASGALIYAAGGVSVQGEDDSPAVFTSTGDIGQLSLGWGLFMTGGSEVSISHAVFENLFIATTFNDAVVSVTDSRYSNNERVAIELHRSGTGFIGDNDISGFRRGGSSVGIRSSSDNISIERNNIAGMDVGLALNAGSPAVRENTITGTMFGVSLYAPCCVGVFNPVITNGNTITGNDYGIYSQNVYAGIIAVNGNNIHDNGWNYYKIQSTVIEDATGNWWGTSVESEVTASISAQAVGTVTYVPFLAGPIPVAPHLNAGVPLTTSSVHTVTGTAQPGTQVRLYVNAVAQTAVGVTPEKTFSGQVSLSEGINAIHAESFNLATTSSPSVAVTVTLDTNPPVITLTAPSSGTRMNTNPTFIGTLSEPTILEIDGERVTVGADNTFSHGPIVLVEGSNEIELRATDLAGHVTTLTVGLDLDTTPPADPDVGLVTFGPLSGGTVTVIGSPGSAEPGAEVHVANARTGAVSTAIADAQGAFGLAIAAEPGDTLTLVATDDLGNQTAWHQMTVPGTPLALAIGTTNPIDGATVTAAQIAVSGDFQGPEGTGITIAGHPAIVHSGRFVVSNIALVPGLNVVDITATAPDGSTVSHTMSLTRTVDAIPFSVSVSPEAGDVPYAGRLMLSNETRQPMQLVEIDLEDDGNFESSFQNLNYETIWWNIWYTTPGLHRGRIRVVDFTGAAYEMTFGVMAQDAIGVQAGLRAMYRHAMTALRAGNIAGALNRFVGTSRQRYETIFNSLGSNLSDAVDALGDIENVTVGDDWAELLLIRDEDGTRTGYRINVIRGEDGVWRIEEM